MTQLTFTDRFLCALARHVERPTLAAIPSHAVLRAMFAATSRIGSRLPAGTARRSDGAGGLWLTPANVTPDAPILVYYHGGGFTIGSPATHQVMAAHLGAAAGMRVLLPRYPLAPEHPFPAAPLACFAAYRALCDAGTPPAALAGDSAGGNLALVTTMMARDAGLPLPRALGLIGPVADMTDRVEAMIGQAPSEHLLPAAWARRVEEAYLRGQDPRDPRASPLLGDLSGLPPTLLHVAEGEALAPHAERLAKALPDATLKVWPGLQHVWHLRAGSAPAATRACAAMGAFIGARAHP